MPKITNFLEKRSANHNPSGPNLNNFVDQVHKNIKEDDRS